MRRIAFGALTILSLIALPACGNKSGSRNDAPGNGEGTPTRSSDEKLGSWSYLTSGATANLNDVAFMYGAGIFAVGDGGTLLVSTDVGKTWATKDVGTKANLYSIRWVNDVFYIGGDNIVLFSQDQGQTFTTSVVEGVVRSMDFTSSGAGRGSFWVAGDNGFVAKAELGDQKLETFDVTGLVWEKVTITNAPDLTGISTEFSKVLVVGKGGFVANSIDLGANFERVHSISTSADYLAIDGEFMGGNGFVAQRAIVSGWPVGSFSWKLHGSSDLPRIEGLRCISTCELVGVKDGGSVIMTLDNAFEVKEVQAEHIGAKLNALTGLTGDGRIAVGESGTILVRPATTKK